MMPPMRGSRDCGYCRLYLLFIVLGLAALVYHTWILVSRAGIESTVSPSSDEKVIFQAFETPDASLVCEDCVRKSDECLLSEGSRPDYTLSDIYRIEESASHGCPLCAAVMYGFNGMKERWPNQQILDKPERKQVGWILAPNNHTEASGFNEPLLDEFAGQLDETRQYLSVAALGKSQSDILEYYTRLSLVKLREPLASAPLAEGSNCTWSTESLSQIQSWLSECQKSHESCNALPAHQHLEANSNTFLPSRLLDVGTSQNSVVKLVHAGDVRTEQGHSPPYITLSHCWGGGSVLRLERSTIAHFEQELPLGQLSKTYLDAIEVCRALKVRYLWIDSLCIVQDDAADWVKEAAQMSDVYSFAFVTIAASASRNGSGGLFFTPSLGAISPFEVTIPAGRGRGSYLGYIDWPWGDHVESAALNTRAWVLQERLLSRRLLYFTHNQVYWQCREGYGPISALGLRERRCLPDQKLMQWSPHDPKGCNCTKEALPPPGSILGYRLDEDASIAQWIDIVQTYSRMDLTYRMDRLLAVSGLARRLCEISVLTQVDYLAGLWRQQLPSQLLWYRGAGPEVVTRSIDVAPSWSWASVNAPVSFSDLETLSPHFKVLAASSKTGADLFGQVSGDGNGSGTLRVQARLRKGFVAPESEQPRDDFPIGQVICHAKAVEHRQFVLRDNAHIELGIDVGLVVSKPPKQGKFNNTQIFLLLVDDTQGLILHHNGRRGVFRRVGHWSMKYMGQEALVAATFDSGDDLELEPKFYLEAHGDAVYTVEIV